MGEVLDGEEFYHGDIFVFQLNPLHSYFASIKPTKIENIQQIVNNQTDDENYNKLPLSFKVEIHKKENEEGKFWYYRFDEFIVGQMRMTNVDIKVRENTGWK